ncbi:MAG: hypothetical protein H6Q89_1880 [Myxococcaceae bacterium]|nr:hypothetical protein [Myxococcaceae bacterium]
MTLYPLARLSLDAPQLARKHPPRFTDGNKKLIHAIACPAGVVPGGSLEASRWRAEALPPVVPSRAVRCEAKAGIYDYPPPEPGTVAWHVNFADASLFYGYGSGLFAQDEMQVAEHPILASLRELLLAESIANFPPLTTENDLATPVLVMGAERSCAIVTERGGRSIYGNAMHRAHPDTIRELVTRLDPPTTTHVLAMEAPPGGSGRYGPDQLSRVVRIATTGFAAAREESRRAGGPEARTVIHTGHWGCGAYGGNQRLMALLQLMSARLAEIDQLVFHTFDPAGNEAYEEALGHHQRLAPAGSAPPLLKEVLRQIDDLGYRWGSSDGN